MNFKKAITAILSICLAICLANALLVGCGSAPEGRQPVKTSGFEFREKLSEYGFFTQPLKNLHPQNRVIHYTLNTPLFTDYAVKDRFVVLPAGKKIKYSGPGLLDFPDSTIILKNFAYTATDSSRQMIETRMLVKDPQDHQWKVMDYLWNEQQTDAFKNIIGASLPIRLRNEQNQVLSTTYKVPNVNDCKRCHNNNNVLTPIGPKARNLNGWTGDLQKNQLAYWAEAGWLEGLPDLKSVAQLPDWKDSLHYSLDQRARAYLDINCAHCHMEGGDASNTGLFLNYEQKDLFHLGVLKEPVSAGNGAGGLNYDIIPADAAHSILAYRMNSAQPGTAMPELGRTLIHQEGVALISRWIAAMKPVGR